MTEQAPTAKDPRTIPGPTDKQAFLMLAKKAYGWSAYTNGEVAGLVAGDMGYDSCDTQWGALIALATGAADRQLLGEIHDKLAELAALCEKALTTILPEPPA